MRKLCHLAALPGLLFLVSLSTTVFAQDALTSFQEPDRVIVTGSLIPTAEEVTATPVDQLGRRDIDRTGSVQVLEILMKRVPDIIGYGNIGPTNADIQSGVTQGGSQVSLRGVATLTLFEGRRIADSAAIAAGGFQFADVSVFPVSLISRIEVLKDGASALYGSDAVGGVINIFLKHDYKGVEVGYRYGFTPTSGTQNTLAWVIAGSGSDKTNVTVGYQYYQSSGLFLRERAYSSPSFGTVSYGGVARSRITGSGNPYQYYLLNPGLNSPFDVQDVTPGSQSSLSTGAIASAYQPVPPLVPPPGNSDLQVEALKKGLDLSELPTSVLLQNNQNFIASFTHELAGKRLVLIGDVLYSNNHSESFLNPQPMSVLGGIVIPRGHVGTGPGDPTIYNPFTFDLSADATPGYNFYNRYSFPRTSTNQTSFIRLLGGVRSQISKEYSFEAAYYYSDYSITRLDANLVNLAQMNEMIAGTARDFSGNLIPSFDFFALNPIGSGPGQVSRSQLATVFGTAIYREGSNQKVVDAKLTGFPFQLPAGPLGFAVGTEYRRESFFLSGSPNIFANYGNFEDVNASRNILSAYLELSIPLVSPQMKVPGVYSMDLSVAGRHERFSGYTRNANVPKVTFRYQPMQDLTIRASFSNSFVAPNLYQLFGPTFVASVGLELPAAPPPSDDTRFGEPTVLEGSNPKLAPSTAQNWGAGAVYSPKWARGLTISADYFNILQKDAVDVAGANLILNSVNMLGTASPYYSRVRIGSFQGQMIPPTYGPNGNGSYYVADNLDNLYVDDRLINLGSIRVTGWDFSISYTAEMGKFGVLQLGANAVLYVNNDFRPIINLPYQNVKGASLGVGGGTNPAYNVNMLAEYRYGGWTLGFTGHYMPIVYAIGGDGYRADFKTADPKIPDYFQVDAHLSYAFPISRMGATSQPVVAPKGGPVRSVIASPARWYDGLTLTIGCNNLFNLQPPFVNQRQGNTDLSTYDPYGRLVYFQIAKRF